MREYHKINSVFKRDERGKFILGDWSTPEFEYLQNNQWVWTEKVDGMNIRVIWDGELVKFGGKTDNAQIPTPLYERLTQLFPLDKFYGKDAMCLYGEGYGRKIQKGGGNYNPNGVDFVLFDVRIGEWWLKRYDIVSIGEEFSVSVVPIVGKGGLVDAIEYTQQPQTSWWGDFLAEGIVLRPEVELQSRAGNRIITKLKYKDFVGGKDA